MNTSRLPLSGITVLDASRVLAGPFCTMLLSDLGARVIKIEDPWSGDETRKYQPMIGNESSYFLSVNRNKESVFLDLTEKNAREKLLSLVKKSDVFVHNFLPRVEKKLGVTFKEIKGANERILYVTISTYGRKSRRSNLPGYDILMQGESGLLSVTGKDEDTLARVGNSTVDIYAGYSCATAILSYLFYNSTLKRKRSFRLDIPLIGSAIYSMPYLLGSFAATGKDPVPLGIAHPGIVPYQAFDTKDGKIIIAIANNNHWEKFCRAIHRDGLLIDKRFRSNEERVMNRKTLIPLLAKIMKGKRTKEWLTLFRRKSIPAAPINKISDILRDHELAKFIDKQNVRSKNMLFSKLPITENNRMIYSYRKDPPVFADQNKVDKDSI